jgi:Peptidase family S41
MKKATIGIFIVFFFDIIAVSQDCTCKEKIIELDAAIKRNYAGFYDKVKGKKYVQYLESKTTILNIADTASDFHCHYLIKKYVSYFRDQHLSILLDWGKVNSDDVIGFFQSESKINIEESTFKSYLDSNWHSLDKIVGIWRDLRNQYTYAVVGDTSNANIYFGVILIADNYFWRRGQIKFVFRKEDKGQYTVLKNLDQYHLPVASKIDLDSNIINIRPFGVLKRVYPVSNFKHELAKINSKLQFSVLNDSSCYISLPSFNIYAKKNIEALIAANKQTILKSKNFIIDIRDNSGGSVYCYDSLLPILYTNPIIIEGGTFFSSVDNIKDYEKYLEDSTFSDKERAEIQTNIIKLKKNIGRHVSLWADKKLSFDTVHKFPKNIAILINQNTASSAELFLKSATQSKKVVIFGENSSGTLDYGDVNEVKAKCFEKSKIYLPRSRFNSVTKHPNDIVGIAPDVRVPVFVSNWITFVQDYFEKLR